MKRPGYLLLAATAGLVLLGVWRLASMEKDRPAAEPSAFRSEARLPESQPAPDLEGATDESTRDLRDRIGLAEDRAPSEPTLPEETEGAVRGTVVDGRNKPVPGAEVTAIRDVAVGRDAFDAEARRRERQVARTSCDPEGKFELRVASDRPHELRASSPGFVEGIASDIYAGQGATIVLRRGATLSGVVRRKEGLTPVADARMVLVACSDAAGAEPGPEWEGQTDEKGRYLAENVQPGSVLLLVFPEQQGETAERLRLGEGETRTLDVSVSPGTVVLGEVKDAQTGQPIAGAEVSANSFILLFKSTRTDESGRFELPGLSPRVEPPKTRLLARAPGYGTYEIELEIADEGVLRADFELVRGRVVSGRVVARDGTPVADATVAAVASRREKSVVRGDHVSARSGADGKFKIAGVRTDVPHGLVVRKEHFATAIARQIDAGVLDEADLGDVVIAPGASLEGTVATSAGDPIQAARVDLKPEGCDAFDACPLERSVSTDAKGFFRFADLASGKQVLQVDVEGVPLKKGWTVELAEGESKSGFEIIIGEGRSISGRVVDPHGLGIENADVLLRKPGGRSDASARSRRDGAFQFNGLERGDYDLRAGFPDEYGPPDDHYRLIAAPWMRVAAGASDIVLRLRRAADITGRVTTLEGVEAAQALVLAVDAQGRPVDVKHADLQGRFTLQVPADEMVELRAWATERDSEVPEKQTVVGEGPPQVVRAGVRGGDRDIVLALKP